MRNALALLFLLPSLASAQTKEMVEAIERKLDSDRTAKWVFSLQAPDGGFYLAPQDPNIDAAPRPSLRATSGAVRALKYRGFPLLKGEREKHAAFVLSCYDPKTGAFAEPGGKPDVAITSVGVMAALELGIPKEKFAKAMDYLKENAKTFEEVRIGAAAVEAWGVKDCPFDRGHWLLISGNYAQTAFKGALGPTAARAREAGSLLAFSLRLNPDRKLEPEQIQTMSSPLLDGQRADGGWGKSDEKASDIETTYRVMRALMLLKVKPKDVKKLREFVASHRNEDGGYATKPGDKSTMSGVYYATIITKWLDEMEAKK
ncbi:MAG TPA: prenyltransferase/squalene oxidase repeat-containing protein [Gemmata sp.]|nr:prenyltransferase/squalene oxidase repeat-containing protein [Gemmata sp.]